MGNPKNHNIVLLRLPFCSVIKFNLRHLRLLLMAMNLVILYTAVILYQSFEKIDSMKRKANKGLTRNEKDQDSFYTSNHWLHEHYHVIDHAFNHADQILFGQSEYNNNILYTIYSSDVKSYFRSLFFITTEKWVILKNVTPAFVYIFFRTI